MVLIDDVQFLARKERTREEFFHTFNALQDAGRQLVLTSDRDPAELVGIEDRLSERFRSGLVVGLEPPEPEVRRVILEKRARLDGVGVAPEVLDEIAQQVTTSVRALEGSLIQVVAHASVRGEDPSPESVRRLLGGGAPGPARELGFDEVISAAAGEVGVSSRELRARDRRPPVVWARQLAMYLARELTGASLPDIGRAFGGRNHTTVLHAVRRVRARDGARRGHPYRCGWPGHKTGRIAVVTGSPVRINTPLPPSRTGANSVPERESTPFSTNQQHQVHLPLEGRTS